MGGVIGLGVIIAALQFLIGPYDRLVTLRNYIENAWAQIDVQLRRHYSARPGAEKLARVSPPDKECGINLRKGSSRGPSRFDGSPRSAPYAMPGELGQACGDPPQHLDCLVYPVVSARDQATEELMVLGPLSGPVD